MPKSPPHHPQIFEYLRKYQEDPSSRVFAPLAEAYRKSGLVDEAIEIAREGLRIHPQFIGGRVALARALFDKSSYSEVVEELSSVVQDAPDNIVAQRLIAESFLMLGRTAESLSAYKMLLYFCPSDAETAKIVAELEAQAYERGTLVLRNDPPPSPEAQVSGFDIQSAHEAIDNSPERQRERLLQPWIRKVEALQTLLVKVERYRFRSDLRRDS